MSSAPSSSRPVTSKPRGVCRYYTSPRGCFAGDKCKFLHGEPLAQKPDDPPLLTPYDKAKRCRYYAKGFCKMGDKCWFLHTSTDVSPPVDEGDEDLCSICFEKPATFGLLGGCSHIFCITCIKQWRESQKLSGGMMESGNTKKCPMCRTASKFITPSSKFWKDGTAEKAEVIKSYKESMARVPCRYFQQSLQKNENKPACPYGKDCFYQHQKADGTPHAFKDGVDVSMPRYRMSRSSRGHSAFGGNGFVPFSLELAGMNGLDLLIPGMNRFMRPPFTDTWPPRNPVAEGSRRPTGVVHAARRLREVGRSLEMLNDAISEGATLESLNVAVEALRAGLGRLEGTNGAPSGSGRRQTREASEGAEVVGSADADEDEVLARLETLADQMLDSLNALRQNAEAEEPFEPNGGPSRLAGTIPPRVTSATLRGVRIGPYSEDEDADSGQESMPGLQSVSDSDSEGEGVSDPEDSDEEELGPLNLAEIEVFSEVHLATVRGFVEATQASQRTQPEAGPGTRFVEAMQAIQWTEPEAGPSTWSVEPTQASEWTEPEAGPNTWSVEPTQASQRTQPEAGPSTRFSTVVDPPPPTTDIDNEAGNSDDGLPALEPIPIETPTRPSPPTPEPPFVTDGRGRVVWTSPAEEDKTSRPEDFPTSRVTSGDAGDGSGEGTGTGGRGGGSAGRGRLLGWLNALF